jgi:catechol 2,3-dioxygenase-like lactoylglutathione lyase family enzyme
MAEPPQPAQRMVVGHFIVSDDVERSTRFYTEVLGGTVVFGPVPTNVALANTFIIINGAGGPTDDKPTVTLETPSDPDRVSSFLNIRVADIHAAYAEERPGRAVPDAAEAARLLDPLLHPRSRRLHHRGRANHRPTGRLVARRLANDQPRRPIRLNPVSSMSRTACRIRFTSRRRVRPRSPLLVVAAWPGQRSDQPTMRLLRYHRWFRPLAPLARTGGFPRRKRSAL